MEAELGDTKIERIVAPEFIGNEWETRMRPIRECVHGFCQTKQNNFLYFTP